MASLLTSMDLPSTVGQQNNNLSSENVKRKTNLKINSFSKNDGMMPQKAPLSTPRRRLRQALDLEKAICQKLEQQGWTMIIRAGKKIGSIYALVTGYTKFPDVRLAVYQTNNSRIQEIIFDILPTIGASIFSRIDGHNVECDATNIFHTSCCSHRRV